MIKLVRSLKAVVDVARILGIPVNTENVKALEEANKHLWGLELDMDGDAKYLSPEERKKINEVLYEINRSRLFSHHVAGTYAMKELMKTVKVVIPSDIQ